MLLAVLGAGYAALFWLLLRSLCARPHKQNYTKYKAAASAGFIAVALACGGAGGAWGKCFAMLPGLCLYFLGDVLLGVNNRLHDVRLLGAGAFLFWIGHLFLIQALAARLPLSAADFLLPLAGVVIVAAILLKLKPAMPKWFFPGVVLYAFTICLFTAKCLNILAAKQTTENVLLAAAGVLFLVSDSVIPFVHLTPKKSLPLHILNLSSYYGGMFLLGASLYFAV